jgi:cytoskeletal protein CcmA (bactofilin family)
MFGSNKKNSKDNKQIKSDKIETIIGENTELEGKIISSDSIRVEGKINGSIEVSGDLIIGKNAFIKNKIKAAKIIIAGKVEGEINAQEKVELLKNAKVTGNISSNSLKIEEGAIFNGSNTSLNTKNKEKKISLKEKREKKAN